MSDGNRMIRAFSAEETLARAGQLAEVLLDCIAGGASVSFMEDFSRDEATEYWRAIAAEVRAGRRVLFAAGEVDGTAQLVLEVPPNQPHRAELAKMLVHRRARRRGVGRTLFGAVEEEARQRGKTLLTFDTMAGGDAERLYIACGCTKVGEVPGYALFATRAGVDLLHGAALTVLVGRADFTETYASRHGDAQLPSADSAGRGGDICPGGGRRRADSY